MPSNFQLTLRRSYMHVHTSEEEPSIGQNPTSMANLDTSSRTLQNFIRGLRMPSATLTPKQPQSRSYDNAIKVPKRCPPTTPTSRILLTFLNLMTTLKLCSSTTASMKRLKNS